MVLDVKLKYTPVTHASHILDVTDLVQKGGKRKKKKQCSWTSFHKFQTLIFLISAAKRLLLVLVCSVLLLMGPMMLFCLGSPLKFLVVFLVFVFTDSSKVLSWMFV